MDIADTFGKSLEFADDSFESKEEARKGARESHAADMLSDNKLSKLLRPIITLSLLGAHILSMLLSMVDIEIKETITEQNTWMLMAAISFYFGSKGMERIAEKKAITEIRVKRDMAKAAIEKEKILLSEEVKDNKAERRANKKPFFTRK
tara:strand:- start:4254 stop:4700 length:447 start_codon:yes stop_codon:yes gene_type:complete